MHENPTKKLQIFHRQVSPEALLELLRQGAEQLASQPVAEAEFQAAFAELAAGGLRAVRKAEDKELREPWMNFHGICMNIIKYHIYIYIYILYIIYMYMLVGSNNQWIS